MFVGINRRCVVAIFPISTLTRLALVIFLRNAASDQLHAIWNNIVAGIPSPKKVDMIRGNDVIEDTESVAPFGLI